MKRSNNKQSKIKDEPIVMGSFVNLAKFKAVNGRDSQANAALFKQLK